MLQSSYPIVRFTSNLRVKLSEEHLLKKGFAKTFNDLRCRAGLTQRQFSDMAGISFSTTCSIESGRADTTAQFETWFVDNLNGIINGRISASEVTPFSEQFKVTKSKKVEDGVGESFKKIRYSFGLTQAELAKAARCSIQSISRIEANYQMPSQEFVNWLKENGDAIKSGTSYFPTNKTLTGVKKVTI